VIWIPGVLHRLAQSGVNYSLATNKPEPSLIPFSSDRRPWPQFVGTTQYRTDGGANYDSLSVEASRRVGQLMFDNHYTWAHGMSNTLNLQNPYAPLYWNRQFLAKHRLVFNIVWDLPFGSGRRYMSNAGGVANQILGGWRAVWVAYFQSGQYFSPAFPARIRPTQTPLAASRIGSATATWIPASARLTIGSIRAASLFRLQAGLQQRRQCAGKPRTAGA